MGKDDGLTKWLIPIANGTWLTPEQLAKIGIHQMDVARLRTVLEGIVKKKRIIGSSELKYFGSSDFLYGKAVISSCYDITNDL